MDIKKEELKEVAREEFRQLGYKKVNVSSITRKIGIGTGSFYHYYPSKEELFLEIFIEENNRVRRLLIEKIDWQAEPEELIESLFSLIIELNFSNKILAEWSSDSSIATTLHDYYISKEGKEHNYFHQFILQTMTSRLTERGFESKKVKEILKVYEFIYFVDTKIVDQSIEDYEETLKILLTYFLKGLLY